MYRAATSKLPGEAGAAVDRIRINFSWLHKLRWAALAGQLTAIVVVHELFHIELPVARLFALLALGALSNLALGLWLAERSPGWPAWAARGDWLLGSLMVFDNLLLTALLYYSGGPSNPFTVFYLVNIALAAVILQARWAWVLNAAAFACFALLFAMHVPVAALEHGHDHEHAMHRATLTAPGPMSLHLQGSLVAFGGAATFIVYFITRVTTELARREAELAEAGRRKEQSDKLESLATLAAGAAHELASPLSTIAVLARDLELSLADESVEDMRLIRGEIDRCRRILDSLASSAGEGVGEQWIVTSAAELLHQSTAALSATERLEIVVEPAAEGRRFRLPQASVSQALRAIVQNALQASTVTSRVTLAASWREQTICITIADRGAGMSEDVLRHACEPFFTTKEPGAGMGLGLFLARRVVERLGGSLSIESKPGAGTMVKLQLPVEASLVAPTPSASLGA